MKLITAQILADNLVSQLSPYCTICLIAGSIRRQKPEPRDIEIVCLPKKILVNSDVQDLFGQIQGQQSEPVVSPLFIKEVNEWKKVKGEPTGKYTQRIIYITNTLPHEDTEIKLDLFMPDDFDFWRQATIRTGSADWVQQNIAKGWLKVGWCGSDKGLRKISDCERIQTPDGKWKWKCVTEEAELPPYWKTEKEFFEWLKIDYIEPENRNVL